MSTQLSLISPDVHVIDGIPKTTSLNVAETFGKRHDDILKRFRNLDCSPEFNARNFAEVDYLDQKGEKRPLVEMTRNGFIFMVMGFTGAKAAQVKEAYINRFDAMEAALRQPSAPEPETVTLTLADYVAMQSEINGLLKDKLRLLEIEKTTQPRRRNLTDAEKARIRHLSLQGYGPTAIAQHVGRSVGTVETCLRQLRQGGAK